MMPLCIGTGAPTPQSPIRSPALPSPRLAVMYTHFLSLLMGRGLPGAQDTKLRRDPSDHLQQHQEEHEAEWRFGELDHLNALTGSVSHHYPLG